MKSTLGRGPFGSLQARVRDEVTELFRDNKVMRQQRHPWWQRVLRGWLNNRTLTEMLGTYMAIVAALLVCEWAIASYVPCLMPSWNGEALASSIADVTSYFIAAQIGILAIVSVAVAVVTLLSQNDNAAAVKTDVRLYYGESFSYELVTSAVALLLVLTVQLFWPANVVVHALGLTEPGRATSEPHLTGQVILTGVHTLWQAFNLLLFFQFTTTTLRFVEPAARESMREVYSANNVIPRDLSARLATALYLGGPANLFGAEEIQVGPQVTFGHEVTFDDRAIDEIELVFAQPSYLKDVWLRPLAFAVASWRDRVRKTVPKKARDMFGRSRWDAQLAFPVLVGGNDLDKVVVVQRDGGIPLRAWEKFVVRHSFRFARRPRRRAELLTPSDFLEGLTDKLIAQIDKEAVTGFKAVFKEITTYHRFVLAAQNTRDEGGRILNLAEVGGGFSRPDEEWVREYRRAYDAAAEKMGADTAFMDWLSYLPNRLLPEDAPNFSPRVLKSIVELGIFQVLALQSWVTKHTLTTYAPASGQAVRLAGSDQRAYEKVLINFTGAWETLGSSLRIAFRPKKPKDLSAAENWKALTLSWPGLETHLQASAYFVCYSIWNEDEVGAERFRDLLLRWLSKFYDELSDTHQYQRPFLLTPDILDEDWARASTQAGGLLRFAGMDQTAPKAVFGLAVLGAHQDVVTICAALALLWYAEEQLQTDVGARSATKLLRREVIAGEGSDLSVHEVERRSIFRVAFDLLARHGLNPRFGESGFGPELDDLVRRLSGVASRRMVPGRGYSGWGLEGIDVIQRPLLAIMAANMPVQGDDGVFRDLTAMLEAGGPLADNDLLRNFNFYIGGLISALGDQVDKSFERCIRAFGGELDAEACRASLHDLLTSIAGTLRATEDERRRNAPLDEVKLAAVRNKLAEKMLADGQAIAFLAREVSDILESWRQP